MNNPPRFQLLCLASGLSALLLLTGCFETKDEYTLNPDGSGKVVHECTYQNMNLNFSGGEADPQEALKSAVLKVLEASKGIEAWRDVSYRQLDDGRLYFKGTAYFRNLSRLDIPNQTMLEFDWTASPGGGVLTLRTNKGGGPVEGVRVKQEKVDLAKLAPEERAKKIKEERGKFQQMKPMMAGVMGAMKHEVILHLPGKVVASANFTKEPSGALALNFEGTRLLEAMDKLVNDDAWLEKNINSVGVTEPLPMDDAVVNEMVFGSREPVRAVVSEARQPVFDYAAELAAAKQAFAGIKEQLGASPVEVAPPAQGGDLKALKIVGVQFVLASDSKQEMRPFNQDEGCTVALLAELPGRVLALTDESGLDSAIADDGSDLLPESKYNRGFRFPKLSKDGTEALLEAGLKLPAPGVKGFRELSGHLQYQVAGSTKEIDLGFTELQAGGHGSELGAEIQSIKEGWHNDGSKQMDLKLKISKEALKAVYLVVGETKTELERRGYGGWGDSYTFTYECKTGFPAKGRLKVEIYDSLQPYDVQFKLENVSLLGKSLDQK